MRTAAGCTFVALLTILPAGCSRGPSPSHVASSYRGKLTDDTLVEASTTVLVTKREVVIAVDCAPLAAALRDPGGPVVDVAVAAGAATRLPAGVTLYTPPFSPQNQRASPLVVTDDKYAGRLCTPDAYDVLKE